jgi:hypothetical protein
MKTKRLRAPMALLAALLVVACAGKREMVVDLYGSVIYEKPRILEVSHTLTDAREQGGQAVVQVSIQGDPGLAASFDIYPGVVDRHPMEEGSAGDYRGTFRFPLDEVAGTFTITGRLAHADAGEVVLRDPVPLNLARMDRR